MTKNDLIHAT